MINKSGDKIIGKMAIAPIGGKKIFNEYMIKSKIREIGRASCRERVY